MSSINGDCTKTFDARGATGRLRRTHPAVALVSDTIQNARSRKLSQIKGDVDFAGIRVEGRKVIVPIDLGGGPQGPATAKAKDLSSYMTTALRAALAQHGLDKVEFRNSSILELPRG